MTLCLAVYPPPTSVCSLMKKLVDTLHMPPLHYSLYCSMSLCYTTSLLQVDRSPTGSGVTARIALQYSKGHITVGQRREFKAINGSVFTGAVVKETTCGQHKAVIVEVGGKGHYTGHATFTLEDDDPFPNGFLLQ